MSHSKASAWLPVLDLLYGYFGIDDTDDPPRRREKVRATLAALDPTLRDTLPHLFALLEPQGTRLIEGVGISRIGMKPFERLDPECRPTAHLLWCHARSARDVRAGGRLPCDRSSA